MGHNGKYLLIEGPTHTERKYVKMLKERLGDNFDYIVGIGPSVDEYDDIDDYEYADDDESYDDDSDESSDEVLDEMEAFDRIFGGDDLFEKMLEVSERVRKSNLEKNHDNNQGEAK